MESNYKLGYGWTYEFSTVVAALVQLLDGVGVGLLDSGAVTILCQYTLG